MRFVVAWLVGTYRPPTPVSLVVTLLIAIPIGVVLRALWVRSWSIGEVLTFALVALIFATMLIGLGRAISAVLGARLFDRRVKKFDVRGHGSGQRSRDPNGESYTVQVSWHVVLRRVR